MDNTNEKMKVDLINDCDEERHLLLTAEQVRLLVLLCDEGWLNTDEIEVRFLEADTCYEEV